MSIGQQLRLRLFLEGQEVPVIAAQVSASVGSPATASIQVIPTDRLMDLKPRTLVHLFFYDYYETEHSSQDDPNSDRPSDEVNLSSEELSDKYKLLFTGEMVGISFLRTTSSRQATLQCVDFTSYWEHAKQCFFDEEKGGSQSQTASFVGAGSSSYDKDQTSPGGLIIKLLSTAPATFPGMKGMLGGLIHMLESVGGVYSGSTQFRGINDFYSLAELRLHITRMIGALEDDTTSAKLINHGKFGTWLNRKIQSLGNIASFQDILSELLGKIFYVTVPCPCAYYVSKSSKKDHRDINVDFSPESKDKLVKARGAVLDAIEAANRAEVAREAPLMAGFAAPAGAVGLAAGGVPLEAGMLSFASVAGDADFMSYMKQTRDLLDKALGFMNSVVEKDKKYIAKTIALCISIKGRTVNIISQLLPAPPVNASTTLAESMKLIELFDDLDAKTGLMGTGIHKKIRRTLIRPSRLFNTFIIPECWFTSPPRSNVIFPDFYGQFSYNRSYLQEITRLQISTSTEFLARPGEWQDGEKRMRHLGSDKKTYYAPKIAAVKSDTSAGSVARSVRVILPHEIYTGIIPAFESMADLAGLHLHDNNVSAETKIDVVQRIANYLFFRRRFAPRSISGAGKFNPFLVPGFTSVVVDRFLTNEMAQIYSSEGIVKAEAALNKAGIRPPVQYFGYLQSVSHSVNQQGGDTSFFLSRSRTHNEKVEFLDVDSQDVKKLASMVRDVSPTGYMSKALIHLVSVSSVTYYLLANKTEGAGEHNEEAWGNFRESMAKLQGLSPTAEELGMRPETVIADMDKADGYLKQARSASKLSEVKKELDPVILDCGKVLVLARTRQLEAVSTTIGKLIADVRAASGIRTSATYNTEKQEVPPEEAIMPPWFAPIFQNSQIGEKVYRPLLGIGSMTDSLEVKSLEEQAVDKESDKQELLRKEKVTKEGTTEAISSRIDPLTSAQIAPDLQEGASIEQAIDHLVRVYAYLKMQGDNVSVSSFIKEYHRRPIATMIDLLDSGITETSPGELGLTIAVTGWGFHSDAFGDVDSMEGLSNRPLPPIGKSGPMRSIDANVDPRRSRYKLVEEYISELRQSRALRG